MKRFGLILAATVWISGCQDVSVPDTPKGKAVIKPVNAPLSHLPGTPDPKIISLGRYNVDIARDCDGFPRINVIMPGGLCMGLVATAETKTSDNKIGLKFPRDILIPNAADRFDDEILILDMGGWGENKGRVLSLSGGSLRTLISGLNLPHAMEYGPGGNVYIAEADKIVRLSFPSGPGGTYGTEPIITDLPYKTGGNLHLHPLKAFAFQDVKTIWVNSGSISDRCRKSLGKPPCDEPSDTAAVLKFELKDAGWTRDDNASARGLRNSMGLAVHSSGTLMQAGNGTDYKDADLPPEELNRVESGAHYGWPYCYGKDGEDADWRKAGYDCSAASHAKPIALLPPHGAPLDLLYAPAGTLGFDRERLIVPLHGYRSTGHRVLMFDIDAAGVPAGKAIELVAGWSADDTKPRGAPVGLTIASDGAIWGVEDKNKTVFRVARDGYKPRAWAALAPVAGRAPDPLYAQLQEAVFKPRCASCHTEFSGTAEQSLGKLAHIGWIGPDAAIDMHARLIAAPPKQMPPVKRLPDAHIDAIKKWLDTQSEE